MNKKNILLVVLGIIVALAIVALWDRSNYTLGAVEPHQFEVVDATGLNVNSGNQTTATSTNVGCTTVNGFESCVFTGSLTQATGTVAYLANPFLATSTVDLAILNVSSTTGALGLVAWTCGTTTTVGATPSATLISSGSLATSTTPYLVNGIGYGASGGTVGNGNVRIGVGPNEIIACFIAVTNAQSVTVASSTITGTYTFRVNR